MSAEFDNYIDNYRPNLSNALSLSGETSIFFAEYKAKKLAYWLAELKNKPIKILDFGCGDGMMTHYVSNNFPQARLYGVDPSEKSIAQAKLQYPHISFSCNSETDTTIRYANATFDLIFAAGAFHHIPHNMHQAYISELKRICKPNGYIAIFELNPLNPLTVITFKRNPIDYNAQMLKPWYAKKLAKYAGKSTIKFYCFFPRVMSRLRFLEPWFEKFPIGALYAIIIKT